MRIFGLASGLVLLCLNSASAAPLYVNFCPMDSTCPEGVTQASLSFIENASLDPNDYDLTLTIEGDATAPYYVDEVSFILGGVQYTDYESVTLTSAPSTGGVWVSYFDNVSASAGSCTSNTGQQHAVCAQSGPGNSANYGAPLQNQTLVWDFLVNFNPGVDAEASISALNLRAQFLNSNGRNAGILSPEPVTVPEPGTLGLLSLGLLGMASCRRRLA